MFKQTEPDDRCRKPESENFPELPSSESEYDFEASEYSSENESNIPLVNMDEQIEPPVKRLRSNTPTITSVRRRQRSESFPVLVPEYKMRSVVKGDFDEIMVYNREIDISYLEDSIHHQIVKSGSSIVGLMFVTPDDDCYHIEHLSATKGLVKKILSTLAEFIKKDNYQFDDVFIQVDKYNDEIVELCKDLECKKESQDISQDYMSVRSLDFVKFFDVSLKH